MSPMRLRWLHTLLIVSLWTVTGLAQPPDVATAADPRAKYITAQKLYKDKRFEQALPMFRQVADELDSPNARMYVARCLRELGRYPEAHDQMRATVRDAALRAVSEARFVPTRDSATKELAELRQQVAFVVVRVPEPPATLAVRAGGRELPRAELGRPFAVSPGTVVVEASAPGYAAFRTEVQASTDAAVEVSVKLSTQAVEPVAPASLPSPQNDVAIDSGGANGTNGWIVGGAVLVGVGVAGMAMFTIAGVMANGRFDELDDECGGGHCPDPSYDERIDEGETFDTVANVGLGVGIAGLVAGGTLILVGALGDDVGDEAAGGIDLVITPSGAWAGYRMEL